MPKVVGQNGFLPEYCNADSLNRVCARDEIKSVIPSFESNFFILQVGHWINQSKKSLSELSSDQFQFAGGCPQTLKDPSSSHDEDLNMIRTVLETNLENVFWVFDCVDGNEKEILESPCFELSNISEDMFLSTSMRKNVRNLYGIHQNVPILVFRKEHLSQEIVFTKPKSLFFVVPSKDFLFQRVLSTVPQKWSVHLVVPKKNILQNCLDFTEHPSLSFRKMDFSYWSHSMANDIWLQKRNKKHDAKIMSCDYKLSSLSSQLLDNAEHASSYLDFFVRNPISKETSIESFSALKTTVTQETSMEVDTLNDEETNANPKLSLNDTVHMDDTKVKENLNLNEIFVKVDGPWTLESFLRYSLCVFP